MLTKCHNLKVVEYVILAVAIFVMNRFAGFDAPSDVQFHDANVLKDVFAFPGERMVWRVRSDVTILIHTESAFPCRMILASESSAPRGGDLDVSFTAVTKQCCRWNSEPLFNVSDGRLSGCVSRKSKIELIHVPRWLSSDAFFHEPIVWEQRTKIKKGGVICQRL